ncbi:MAG: hypothetical protein E7623_03510 [Ruminococcaceae bacterium]|nr:hypothetical protein [Oscillospiraceae bacterium]
MPLFFAVLGILHSYLYSAKIDNQLQRYTSDTEISEIEATVLSASYKSNYLSTFDIRVHRINEEKVNFKMRFEAPYLLDVELGDKIISDVIISDIENDGSFDEKQYLNSKGIYFLASEPLPSCTISEEKNSGIEIKLSSLNQIFSRIFKRVLDENSAGLIGALFLGNRDDLSDITKRDFKRTGCYHILALSGMHLAIISTMLDFILIILRLKKGPRFVISSVLIIFYVALSGFGLSVIRSAIMLLCTYTAYFLRAKKDSFTALLFAAAAIISFSPSAVRDIGFWMSVMATLGIIIASPFEILMRFKLRRCLRGFFGRLLKYTLSGLIMSFAAITMTLPFSCFCFGAISSVGPLVTLLLSSIVSVLLYLAPLLLLFCKIPFIAAFLAFIIDAASKLTVGIAGYFSEIEHVYVSLNYPFVKYAIPIFFIILFILMTVRLKHKIIIPLFVLVFAISFSLLEYIALNDDTVYVKYLRVKENEYICMSKNGENSIIDVSTGSFSGLYEAYNEALEIGYREIDTVVLTHVHKKHISALRKLSSKELLHSIMLPVPINETERPIAESIKYELEKEGVKVIYYDAGQNTANINGCAVSFDRNYIKRSSHPAIMLRICGDVNLTYVGSSYLEMNPIEITDENIILGTHGPICKNDFTVYPSSSTKTITIADEEINSYAHIEGANNAEITLYSDKICFKVKSQEE